MNFITTVLLTIAFSWSINDYIIIDTIQFKVVKKGNSDRKYIWLHGDEQTAKMALEYHINRYGGTAFFIVNNLRDVEFYGGLIDPNRIFSSYGSKRNIHKYNPHWSAIKKKQLLDGLNKDRASFLKAIFPSNGELLIALHNNYKGYNVYKEVGISDSISIKKDQNPRDFYLCTNREDFELLAKSPFNVVLQENSPKKDNGSLSWAAINNKVRYINVETRLGWLSMQKRMLAYIEKNLP